MGWKRPGCEEYSVPARCPIDLHRVRRNVRYCCIVDRLVKKNVANDMGWVKDGGRNENGTSAICLPDRATPR